MIVITSLNHALAILSQRVFLLNKAKVMNLTQVVIDARWLIEYWNVVGRYALHGWLLQLE